MKKENDMLGFHKTDEGQQYRNGFNLSTGKNYVRLVFYLGNHRRAIKIRTFMKTHPWDFDFSWAYRTNIPPTIKMI